MSIEEDVVLASALVSCCRAPALISVWIVVDGYGYAVHSRCGNCGSERRETQWHPDRESALKAAGRGPTTERRS